jgi:hypothetical protein
MRNFSWTEHQVDKLNKVKTILDELEEYKPLTLRQVYYQLVGKGLIENKVSEYTMLSGLMKWARIDGRISWDDMEDRGRVFHDLSGWGSRESFIQSELDNFLSGYRRDLLQSQPAYLEVWIEKDALSSIFKRVCLDYTVPVVVCKGFSSVSFLNNFKGRIEAHGDKSPVMLYFGDFDPSGVEMLTSMKKTLEDELGMPGIAFKRIALQQDDIFTYKLPHNPDAIKKGDTRAHKHIAAFGELAVELDALRPDILVNKVKTAIEAELDLDAFNAEGEEHNSEAKKLALLKKSVKLFLNK